MPRKPTLSPSKISTYLACPTKFMWTYQDPRGKWYVRSKSYYSFGTTLHNVLQRFHDSDDQGVQTTAQALAVLEESWIEAGYTSQDEMMQALAEGKEIITKHVETALREPVTSKTIVTEKLYRRDLGPFVLLGRVDRIDEREDGTIDIIDYKSGRPTVTEDEIKNDLAMSCYQLILAHHFPDRKIAASIIALRSGDRASYSMTPEELTQFQTDITLLGQEILDRDWENHAPTPKDLCPNCDFLPLCTRYPDFDPPATS